MGNGRKGKMVGGVLGTAVAGLALVAAFSGSSSAGQARDRSAAGATRSAVGEPTIQTLVQSSADVCPPTCTLTYHGGNVMTTTTNHLIFWLPPTLQDGSTAAVPSDYISTIEQFFRDENGTSLYNTYTQYCQGIPSGSTSCPAGSQFIQNNATYGGAVLKTDSYPSGDCAPFTSLNCISDGTVQNLIRNAIGSTGWATGLNQVFYVFTAPGENMCNIENIVATCVPGPNGCSATHDFFHTGPLGTGDEVIYAKIPYQACTLPPGPHDPATDVAVSFASHEQAEAITDPDAPSLPAVGNSGWWSTRDNEIGDPCQGTGAFQHWNGHTYLLQEEWSNLSNGCVAGEPSNREIKPTTANAVQTDLPGCTANTLLANDDGSTGSVALPFTVNFFGTSYSSLYVNNNGNVTFESPLTTFTPFGLIATNTPIIAPFFADVDTRGNGSGLVMYGGVPASGGNPAYFCVNWVNVGYFNSHADNTNLFQLILWDRSAETGVAGDFDVVFNYDNALWETGDASGGTGGLGGTSVRAGYSNGSSSSLELTGSGINGALLDGGFEALTSGSDNSTTAGRYIFRVRNGTTPTGGSFHGIVTDTSNPPNPVGSATLQFCAPIGAAQTCAIASTNGTGHYSVTGLPAGQYEVRVSPPSSSALFEKDLGPVALGAGGNVELDVSIDRPRGLPPGTTITSLYTNPDGTPVLDWNVPNTLTTHGCASGSASYTMTIANNQGGSPVSGVMTESPVGSGTYTATVPTLNPQYGPADVVISISCPDPTQNTTIRFSVYIDPAGSVADTDGNPVAGAVVTLYRSDAAAGPFTAVPAGSSIMSPANRVNPDTTTSNGRFGWDVLQGYYKVRASKTGCTAPGDPSQAYVETPVEQIPPAVDNLVLILQCNQRHATVTSVSCLPNTVVAGQSTACLATVGDTNAGTKTTPTGTVGFTSSGPGGFGSSGSCTLSQTSTGVASCQLTYTPSATPSTPVRSDGITASYNGDSMHATSSGSTTIEVLSITLLAHGSFVIGDNNTTVGTKVTFWGAQWWKLNSLSGGPAPAGFTGFARQTPNNPPRCGDHWTTEPGNGSGPPATVPQFMAVIASSSITQSASTISGDAPEVVVVKTNPGYGPNPGQAGTGTVVGIICGG